jgi:uncharacterized delta-60 repeat protein
MKTNSTIVPKAIRRWAVAVFFIFSAVVLHAQSITTGTVSPAPLCSGTAFTVPFSWSTLGTGTHTFQVELSNASGTFTTGTTLLTPTAAVSGSSNSGTYMIVDIPGNVTPGTGYRVRVRRTSGTPVIGSTSSSNITIREAFSGVATTLSENMGTVASGSIAIHESNNRFQNTALTMSGTGATVVTSSASSGYTGASGNSSVLLNANGETFLITGINTSGQENLRLRFGVRPANGNSNFNDLVVEVSDNGAAPWYRHEFANLPSANTWYLRSTEGTIPATSNLHVRFTQAVGGSDEFRIDDVAITRGTPSATVSFSPTTDQTVCPGVPVNFSVTNLSGASFLWSNSATTNSISPTAPAAYSVTVTDASGCIVTRGPVSLINHAASNGGSTSGAATVCSLGNSGTVNLSGQVGNVVRWESSINGGTSWSPISNTTASLSYTNLINTTQYRAVISNQGCAEANSSITTITVTTAPAATVSITTDNAAICANTKVTFIATPTNQGSTPTYQWRKNGANVGLNQPFYIDASLNNGDVVDVILTSNAACVSPLVATSNAITMTVSPYLTPSVIINSSTTQICTGAPLTFTATPTNGGTTPVYQWKVNGTNAGTNSPTFTSSSLVNNDVVTVEMTSSYGCLPITGVVNATWPSGDASDEVFGILKQADGKYMISGVFTSFDGTTRRRAVRLNTNGTVDATFATGSGFQGPGTDWVNEIEQQADGKYICVGLYDEFNGTGINNVARLNANGTLDNSFDVGSGANGQVWSAVIQPDQKVVIAGHFTSYDGTTRRRVARLNSDGSLDAFDPNVNDDVNWVEMQPDGKFIIVGDFTSVGGTGRNRVARIHADGTLDGTFNPGSGANDNVYSLKIQNDGKIIIGGTFTSFNGIPVNRVVRLNANGSIDNTFNVGSGANDRVTMLDIDNHGKVYIAGDLTQYNGNAQIGLVRVNTNGSFDNTFTLATGGFNNTVWITNADASGKLSIGGEFTSALGTTKDRIISTGPAVISNSLTITVNATSVGGTTASAATVCEGANSGAVNVSGNTGAVIRWESSINAGASWNTIANTSTSQSYTNLTQTTRYRAVVANGACPETNSAIVIITVNSATVPGSVSGSATVCQTGNSGTVNLSGQTGSILNWQTSTNGGLTWNTLAGTGSSQNYSGLSTTTLYRAAVKSGVCPTDFSTPATITVNQNSAGGSTSGATTVCSGSNSGSINLSGQTGAVIRWQTSPNGTTWTDVANTGASITYTDLSSTLRYRAVVQSGVCPEANSTVSIVTVNANTVAGTVTSDATVCASANSGTLNLSGQTGAVQLWQSSINGGTTWSTITNTTASQSYTNLSQTTLYRAVVKSGVCPTLESAPATITVNLATNGGTTSGATTVCSSGNSGSINLSGQVGNILRWQTSPNGITWTDVANTSASITYTDLSSTLRYRAVVQSGVCPQANSTVSIVTVNANTIAGAVNSDASECASGNIGLLNLSGQTGSVLLWQSSTNGGASWSSISNTTTLQPYFNLGQTTLYRAVVKSGVCPTLESAPATITVNPATNGGTTSGATTVCSSGNSGSINLSGQVGNILRWQTSPNGTTWTDVANTSTSITYTDLTSTLRYRAVVQSGVCAQANSTVSIVTVNANTVAGTVTSDATVCASANSGTLNLSGQTGAVQLWQSSINGGTTWSTITNTTASQSYTNLNQTTLYRAVVKSGVCPTLESAPATITVFQTPVAGTVSSSLTACFGTNSGTLLLTGYSGTIEKWQLSPNGMTWTDIANTTDEQNFTGLTATTYYRALVDNGPCATVNAVSAIVTVIPQSNGGIVGADQDLCANETVLPVSVNGQNGSVIRWEKSTESTFASPTVILTGGTTLSTFLMGALGDDNYFRAVVQQTGNGCLEQPSAAARVQVFDLPTASISGDASVCAASAFSNAVLNSNANPVDGSIANVIWRRNSGLITGENGTSLTTTLAGTYTAQVFNSFGCQTTSAPFNVIPTEFAVVVNAGANGSFSAPATITCGDNGNVNILADDCYLISEVTVNGVTIIDEQDNLTGYTLLLSDVREDQTVDVAFVLRRFNLSAEVLAVPGTFATITNAGVITRDCGSDVSYSITVDACTNLDNVIINGIGIGPQFNFTVSDLDQSTSIFVVVSQKLYTINATAGSGGSISPAGIQSYGCGENATYIFVPDPGFGITGVSVNGVPVGALVSYTFTNIQQNHAIDVNFAPMPQNNNWVQYQPSITTNLPSCITAPGTLAGCTPSPEAAYVSHPIGSGQDAWYRFRVPDGSSGIVRIRANSVFNNLCIVLQKEETMAPFYTPVAVENAVNGIGEEIMTATNLVPGAFYRIAVKNMGLEAANAFTLCVINVRPTTCGSFSSAEFPLSLCSNFNAGYSAAKSYSFTFTNVNDPSNVITRTVTGQGNSPASTLILLRTPGFRYGATYDVQITALHEFANGAGVIQQIVVDGGIQTCQAIIGAQPQAAIAAADRCTTSPKRTSYVLSADWICGIIDYQWEVTPTVGLPVPYHTRRNFAERFMRIGSLNGINAGGSNFMVRVRPIFANGNNGEFFGNWGPAHEICLVTGLSTEGTQEEVAEGTLETNAENEWNLYPNPNNGETLYLNVPGETGGLANLRIMDAMGRTVLSRTIAPGMDVQSIALPAALTNGLYMVEVQSGDETFKKRLILNK